MKKSVSLFIKITISTLLCALLCIFSLSLGFATGEGVSSLAVGDEVVFVKDGGTGNGSSAAKPLGSFVSAISALSETGGTVVVCGALTVASADNTTPKTEYPVTVTSCYGGVDYRASGAVLTFSISHLYHKGSVNYENINITATEKLNIYYHYNSFTIGEGVTTSYSGNATRYPIIFSGFYATSKTTPATVSNTQDSVATINSGTWYTVIGGNYREVSDNNTNRAIGTNFGRTALIINGGSFVGTSTSYPISATGMNYFSDDVYLEINGGTFSCPVYAVMRLGNIPTKTDLVGERCSSGRVLVRIRGGSFAKNVGLAAGMSNTGNNAYNVNFPVEGDSTFVITGGSFNAEFITYCAGGDLLLKYDPAKLQANFLDLCGNFPIRQIIDADAEPDTQSEFVKATIDQQIDKDAHGADPYVIKDPNDDCYYYVYSSGGVKITKSGNIGLFKQGPTKLNDAGIKTFSSIRNGVKIVNSSEYSGSQPCTQYWAPEIHYIPREIAGDDYGWYCYVAASDSSDTDSAHRMYVYKCPDPENPMCEGWELKGKITDSSNYWAIDGTVITWGGKMYFAWSGRESADTSARMQSIYIAEMSNPWTLTGNRVVLSSPDQSWERYQTSPAVNEGPQAFTHNGKLYLTYSANGSWAKNYCFGLLEYKGSGSLTDPSNWVKRTSGPFFSRNSSLSTSPYGTGHGSVTTAVDGTPWLIFHANPTTETSSDANWWSRRMIYAQPLTFAADGSIIANYANSTTAQNTIAAHNGECCTEHFASEPYAYPYSECLYCAERLFVGIVGDIDCDRTVANSDIAMIVRYLSGYGVAPDFCDLNGDKKINNRDAIALIVRLNEEE